MAMSAYYLKGIAPPQVQLMQIFKGVLPLLLHCVFVSMAVIYILSRKSSSTCPRCFMAARKSVVPSPILGLRRGSNLRTVNGQRSAQGG